MEEKRLKLFVVGEASSDPKTWSSRHAFIIADSPEAAVELIKNEMTPAIEISMTVPMIIGYEDFTWDD